VSDIDQNPSILDDVSASFKSLVTERFTSPFLFSFVVSWLIINHKVVILSFSDATDKFTIDKKFELLNSVLNSSFVEVPFSDKTLLLNGFFFPLISAVFYTFVYPFADYYITKFTLERKVSLRNLRLQKEREIFYTYEDVQKIYSKNFEDEKRWKARLEQAEFADAYKDSLINELQSKIDMLNEKTQSTTFYAQNEINTKLDLARAYVDMKDIKGASELLSEVMVTGNANQKRRARSLIKKLESIEGDLIISEPEKEKNISVLLRIEEEIIGLLGSAANNFIEWMLETELMKMKKFSPIDVKIAVDSLINKQLINREFVADLGDVGVQLTVKGMKKFKKQ
jgi:FimV-like protein